jgi:hypothetical protein
MHNARWLDASQAQFQPLLTNAQPFVVDAEQVQNGGVEVADVHWILHDVVAEGAGFAEDEARLDAAAGHPVAKTARMMIAALIGRRQPAL